VAFDRRPLCVSDVALHPLCEAFIESAMAMGLPRNDDFNGKVQEGVGYHQTTTRDGKRCSTAVGYLRPAMGRPNLQVLTHALTEKIVVENGRATGVAIRQHGQARTIKAKREVIVCAGAIGSPQILMLSGIGPAEHLRQFDIKVVHDLRGVGQSLQDHYSAPIKLKARGMATLNDVMLSNLQKVKAGIEYYLFKRGALTTPRHPRRCSHAPGPSWPRPTSSARSRRSAPTARRTGCTRGRASP